MGRPRGFDDTTVITRAMEAFWTHGYAETSPAILAEATGVAKGSLYNAFGGKRELFDRALDQYQSMITAQAERLLAEPGTTRETIRAALRAVVDGDLASVPRRGCLVGNTTVELAGSDPELARRLRRMQDESTSWFASRIERGQADGDVSRDTNAAALAAFFATTLAGLRVMAMTHDADTLYRVIDTAVATL